MFAHFDLEWYLTAFRGIHARFWSNVHAISICFSFPQLISYSLFILPYDFGVCADWQCVTTLFLSLKFTTALYRSIQDLSRSNHLQCSSGHCYRHQLLLKWIFLLFALLGLDSFSCPFFFQFSFSFWFKKKKFFAFLLSFLFSLPSFPLKTHFVFNLHLNIPETRHRKLLALPRMTGGYAFQQFYHQFLFNHNFFFSVQFWYGTVFNSKLNIHYNITTRADLIFWWLNNSPFHSSHIIRKGNGYYLLLPD